MYKVISKKVSDSPKNSEKSVISGTIQKRASNASCYQKPSQPNLFRASSDNQRVAQLMLNNTGLPDNLKSGVESISGLSMNDVKVHFNSSRPAQLHALAYTQGTDIHVAPGQEKYLPHEAWHVVQQKQHRVKPTMRMMDISVNDDTALEREADVMGANAVVQGKADNAGVLYPSTNATTENIVQRVACLRCMCENELDQIIAEGRFKSRGRESKWFTIGGKKDRPNIKSFGDKNHNCLISFELNDNIFKDHPIIFFKNDYPKESDCIGNIIAKENESNNIGIGCNLLSDIRVKPFEWSTKKKLTSSASKKWETCSEIDSEIDSEITSEKGSKKGSEKGSKKGSEKGSEKGSKKGRKKGSKKR